MYTKDILLLYLSAAGGVFIGKALRAGYRGRQQHFVDYLTDALLWPISIPIGITLALENIGRLFRKRP